MFSNFAKRLPEFVGVHTSPDRIDPTICGEVQEEVVRVTDIDIWQRGHKHTVGIARRV